MKIVETSKNVLILHGLSDNLVKKIKDFLRALGTSAETVTDMPSDGKPQLERVVDAIKSCDVALVVATFDENHPSSGGARPNVLHELTICLKEKPNKTIVLVEERDGRQVDLGSNLRNQFVAIPFRKEEIDVLFLRLLVELAPKRNRIVSSGGVVENRRSRRSTEPGLRFRNKADRFWKLFDIGWKVIPRHDGELIWDFADCLDKMFECYYYAWVACDDTSISDDEVERIAKEKVEAAKTHCESGLSKIAHSLVKNAGEICRKKANSPEAREYRSADQQLRQVRGYQSIDDRIRILSEVINALHRIISPS